MNNGVDTQANSKGSEETMKEEYHSAGPLLSAVRSDITSSPMYALEKKYEKWEIVSITIL